MSMIDKEKVPFTAKQGQYLAFIHFYTKLNGLSPAHTDFQKYFKVTPPTVNQMIKSLEQKGLIRKQPGVPRSIELTIPMYLLPELQ
jgi:DNA-binding MarR family transcriptional regulator